MEASKEGETPEPAPESLPTEAVEGKPKRTMLLAVVIVVILIIAALGAAIGLGVFGKKKHHENQSPVAGAVATSPTSISIGGYVTFNSTSTDPDGYIATATWYFGDGNSATGNTTNHTYNYGGVYWVYLVVTDNDGATADNEASMIRVFVTLYDPIGLQLALTNNTAPFATLLADQEVISANTTVNFNMTGCYAFNVSTNSTGATVVSYGWQYIHSITLDYGDGSAVATITPNSTMVSSHEYTTPGHYAAKLNVTSNYSISTVVILTIHVLKTTPSPVGVKNPDAFVEVQIGEPDYLDPAVDYETAGGEVLQNVYETLVWYPITGSVADKSSATILQPLLCNETPTFTNGLISSDGMNYTFNLKTGIKFHNGEIMNASDVIYSIQRVIRIHDPDGPSWMVEQVLTDYLSSYIGPNKTGFGRYGKFVSDMSPPQWLLDAIGGSSQYYNITEKDNQNVSEAAVTKLNDSAVNFRLVKPYPGFLQIVAYTVMDIVSKKAVEANGGVVNGQHNTWMDSNTVGTGPYQLVSWDVGSKIHCTRFANYHGAAPTLKDVYVIKSNDVNTRILMLQGGDADTAGIPIDYQGLFAGSTYRITKGVPTFDVDFAGFNQNINTTAAAVFGSTVPSDFFTDVHVRKAFTHLVNYTLYLQNIRLGNAIQPNGPIPKGMFGYDGTLPVQEYNLTAARYELENATHGLSTWWTDGFTIALMYNAGNTYREAACQYLKASLEALGSQFHATVNTLDWPTYLANLRKSPSPFPLFWLGWAPDYADPDDYVVPMLQTGGTFPYRTGFSNDSIDANITLAASETNPTLRQALYNNITNLTYELAPYIWMDQPNVFHVERTWLLGYYFNPMYSGFYWPQFSKST